MKTYGKWRRSEPSGGDEAYLKKDQEQKKNQQGSY